MKTPQIETATFAGGCFWCLQHDLDETQGVISTTEGYTGGHKKDPTYEEVCEGSTGHVEAVLVTFDPNKITYKELLQVYWHAIDPTRSEGQFCDVGPQYKPVIFYHSQEQKLLAEQSKKELEKKVQPIVVEIRPASAFYPAEEYHQKYYKKNASRYEFYRANSGREERLKEIWGP